MKRISSVLATLMTMAALPAFAQTPATSAIPTTMPMPVSLPETRPETAPTTSPQTMSTTMPTSQPTSVPASLPSEIMGGDVMERAVLLPLERDLKLNHYQARGRYDFFALDLRAGQTLVLTAMTGDKGVDLRPDNTMVETAAPYASVEIWSQAGKMGQMEVTTPKTKKELEVDASTPQRIYVLVGSPSFALHKDQMGFRAEVKSNFDAGSEQDAGGSIETALKLEKGKSYRDNSLTKNDEADYFKIATTPGDVVGMTLSQQNPLTTLVVGLYDEMKTELAAASSVQPGVPVTIQATANGGAMFLKVSRRLQDEPTKYSIVWETSAPATRPTTAAATTEERPEKPSDETPSVTTATKREPPKPQTVRMVPFRWTDKRVVRGLATAAGSGLLLGLLIGLGLGMLIRGKSKKKEMEETES